MVENQQILIVADKQEQDTQVAALMADGWKTANPPRSLRSTLFPTPEEFANRHAVTLQRNGEKKILKIRNVEATAESAAHEYFRITNAAGFIVLILSLIVLALITLYK